MRAANSTRTGSAAYIPLFGKYVNVLFDEQPEFVLQPAAIDGPVARARAGRRQAAKLRPAVAAKRVRLSSAVTPAAPSAPTPGSYFSGTATALMMGVSSNTTKGGKLCSIILARAVLWGSAQLEAARLQK